MHILMIIAKWLDYPIQAIEQCANYEIYSKDHMKVTGQCNKCEGYPPKNPFCACFLFVPFVYLFFFTLFLSFIHPFCTSHLSYFICIFILFSRNYNLIPLLTRGEKQQKIGSQSILGIYSRGRKAVREEVAEIESGHFSDLRRQQTVWIRSNWLIRAARILR